MMVSIEVEDEWNVVLAERVHSINALLVIKYVENIKMVLHRFIEDNPLELMAFTI